MSSSLNHYSEEQLQTIYNNALSQYHEWSASQKLDPHRDWEIIRQHESFRQMCEIYKQRDRRRNLARTDLPMKIHGGLVTIYKDETQENGLILVDGPELREYYRDHKERAKTMTREQIQKRRRELYKEMYLRRQDNLGTEFERRELNAITNELKGRSIGGFTERDNESELVHRRRRRRSMVRHRPQGRF